MMKNLTTIRKSRNLTQAELAEKIGVTSRMIQRYEKGESNIPMKNLEKLSQLFEVPIAYFYEGDGSNFKTATGTNQEEFPMTFASFYDIAEFFVKHQPEFLRYEIVDKMIRVYEERAIINAGIEGGAKKNLDK